ncbi:50S ribosomal protein L24, chloroplastic [Linum perenne]
MAAIAGLQASMASLSIPSTSFFGERLSFPSISPFTVKSPNKTCLIVAQLKRWERKECKPNSLPVLHKMHVKVGDTVKLIAGDDKGKVGEITKIFRHNSTVIVKDMNLKTKHMKSKEQGEPGQIIKVITPYYF